MDLTPSAVVVAVVAAVVAAAVVVAVAASWQVGRLAGGRSEVSYYGEVAQPCELDGASSAPLRPSVHPASPTLDLVEYYTLSTQSSAING